MSRERRSAYAQAGVDYEELDAGKRSALSAALSTSPALAALGGQALDESRGEPAFAFELGGRTFGFVMEGLGTKSVIARQVQEAGGPERFDAVAYDTVAAIVNDLTCLGALPLVVNAYFATGSSEWYRDAGRHASLVEGWRRACEDAGATWGGGESPSLSGLVAEPDIELAGCAIGVTPEGQGPILGDDVSPGDEIVIVASSGLHANGASLARQVAGGLERGLAAELPGGRMLGEALLDPSLLYTELIRAVLDAGLPVTYLSHITGHGLLKLMRPARELTYRIESLPDVPDVLGFLAGQAGMSEREAYRTLNMGCGYAIYVSSGNGPAVAELAADRGYDAVLAGRVEEGPRRVILEPVDAVYESGELDLGPRLP